jgi:hypothetical protein
VNAGRFPSVPLADDPELAEHALWNDEIAEDLEWQAEVLLPAIEAGAVVPGLRSPSAGHFTSGGVIPNDPGEHGDGVPAILNGGCQP